MTFANFPDEAGFKFKIVSDKNSEDITCIFVEREKISMVRKNETDHYLLSFNVDAQNLRDFIEKSIEEESKKLIQYEHCTDRNLHLIVLPNFSIDNGLSTIGFKVVTDKSKSLEWVAQVVQDPFTRTLQRFIFASEINSLKKLLRD